MKKIIGIFGIVLFVFCSCVRPQRIENERIVEDWLGKEIKLPKLSNQFRYDEKTKIVTSINGNCSQCIFRLKYWMNFIKEINETCVGCEIQYYFYVTGADTAAFKAINDSMVHFKYPVIFDQNNSFYKQNKLNENNLYHTMLLDSCDRVLLIGTPIMNPKLQNLYKEEIIRINSH